MINKHTIHISISLLLMMLLACSLGGCHSGHSDYDQRLVSADSLLHDHPDSAMQMLAAIDNRSLKGDSNRAYHALLLTQARYRCYVAATSDSLINVAVEYYEQHSDERERLTRAYLYKGAVMEELDEPLAAIKFYKQAEETAEPDDYFNQGYIKLRMGKLYNENYVVDEMDITLLKKALKYFEMVPDTFYITTTMSALGSSFAAKNQRDSANKYLKRAVAMARENHYLELENVSLRSLADLKTFGHNVQDIEQAKDIALSLLKDSVNSQQEESSSHLLMTATYTLAKLNKPDSASLFLDKVDKTILRPEQSVYYDRCRAEVARSRGDINQYQFYYEKADHLADSLMNIDLQQRLRDVEAKYDNEALKYQSLRYRTNMLLSLLGTALAVSALAIVSLVMKRKQARRKQLLRDHEDTIERLRSDAAQLTVQLDANESMSEGLKQIIQNQIAVFARVIEQYSIRSSHLPKKFNEIFEKSYRLNQPDVSFWKGIRDYVDNTCNGIITNTIEAAPALTDSDINFLSLYCCGIPTTVIMACMGYNDVHSVYNKKRRIAEILDLPERLDDYIIQFKPTFLSQA